MKEKKKIILAISLVVALLVITLGITYAAFVYRENTNNQQLVLGEIYMYYNEINQLTIENAMPGEDYSNYFEFTVNGMNTYNQKDIYYEVVLTKGDTPEDKIEANRLSDSSILFRLVEVADDDTETVLLEDKTYDDLTSQRIYVATINKGTTTEVNKRYRLYAKISDNIRICGGEITDGCDYFTSGDTLNWSDAFASVKVTVIGDLNERVMPINFVNAVKSKYGTDTTLVAVNTDGTLYDGTGEIREYRYSGPIANNYVFFDTNGDGTQTDDEVWRIVGVFSDTVKDEDGNIVLENGQPTYEEKVKLMRNSVLTSEELPTYYNISGITYTIEDADYPGYAHRKTILSSDLEDPPSDYSLINSDWISSGLSYYLNTEQDESETSNPGYLSFFGSKAKKLLSLTTHHLGGANSKYDGGTAIRVYESERDENNAFSDSKPNWNGYVGLLYPSDYGYSASNTYWTTKLYNYSSTAYQTSWMNQTANHNVDDVEVFITYSNDTYGHDSVWYWYNNNATYEFLYPSLVRPVVHLISGATVLDAAGTIDEPYTVVVE